MLLEYILWIDSPRLIQTCSMLAVVIYLLTHPHRHTVIYDMTTQAHRHTSNQTWLVTELWNSSFWDSVSLLVNRVSKTRDPRGQIPRGLSTWNPATRQAETEPQRLDFGPGNRASEARVATNAYCFKTGPTNWIVWFLWVFTHFHPSILFFFCCGWVLSNKTSLA